MPKRVTKDLTDVAVRKAKATDKQYEMFDRSVGGFALRVSPSGAKMYVVSFRCKGKNRRMTIGNAAVMLLTDAREQATKAKSLAKSGIDPLEDRRQKEELLRIEQDQEALKGEHTFAAVSDLYIQRYAKGLGKTPNKKSWREDERILQKYVLPKWKSRQIAEIRRGDVVSLLDTIEEMNGLYMANRTLAVVRKLFNWAMDERAIIDSVPVGKKMARKGETKRKRVLSEPEVRSFLVATENLNYPFGPLFQLLLMTGQRLGEVAQMSWSQLELDKELWTIPSDQTKAGRDNHPVALNGMAMDVISSLNQIDGSDLLFPTASNANRPISGFSKAKKRCDNLTASERYQSEGFVILTDWRLHDLRRTMGTIMQEELGVSPYVIGAILNHSPDKVMGVTAVYATGKMMADRRLAMDAWGKRLQSISADNIVSLRG